MKPIAVISLAAEKKANHAKRNEDLYADSQREDYLCEKFVLIYLNVKLLPALRLSVKKGEERSEAGPRFQIFKKR